jgi:predicted phosphate transport protein (TIGR00153 family)
MPFTLIPRERRFYDLFDRQAERAVEAARLLLAALDDMSTLPERQREIKDVEHAGDELTHEMVRLLNRTFVTPFDREDIYALGSGLDDVLDYIDEIAETMLLYGITEVSAPAKEMASLLRDAVAQLQSAISKLESKDGALEHGIEVHRIENMGDQASRRAIGELFGGAHDPLTVIKLKEFYTLLEDSLDRCEDVAQVIENIIIKNA